MGKRYCVCIAGVGTAQTQDLRYIEGTQRRAAVYTKRMQEINREFLDNKDTWVFLCILFVIPQKYADIQMRLCRIYYTKQRALQLDMAKAHHGMDQIKQKMDQDIHWLLFVCFRRILRFRRRAGRDAGRTQQSHQEGIAFVAVPTEASRLYFPGDSTHGRWRDGGNICIPQQWCSLPSFSIQREKQKLKRAMLAMIEEKRKKIKEYRDNEDLVGE